MATTAHKQRTRALISSAQLWSCDFDAFFFFFSSVDISEVERLGPIGAYPGPAVVLKISRGVRLTRYTCRGLLNGRRRAAAVVPSLPC